MPRARCAGRKARELGRGAGAGARGGPATGGLRAERAANVYNPGGRGAAAETQAAHAEDLAGGLCGGKARAAERT